MLLSLGIDFREADLELRERFHRSESETGRAYDRLDESGVRELVLVDTCNRVEAYAVAEDADRSTVLGRLATVCGGADAADALLEVATIRWESDVARHAMRVACGLESQVLGDIHILGQLRRCYRRAIEAEAVGSQLHRLFDLVLQSGKRVKRETALMAGHASVGREAVRLAAERVGPLIGRRCVVVGCGKTGSHAARALAETDNRDLIVVNRTFERAERLAREIGARPLPYEELYDALGQADVAVVATGAPEPIVNGAELARARSGVQRPLLVVDVSMPRNVDRSAGEIRGVELVDLDALNPQAAVVEQERQASVEEAEAIVEASVAEFETWRAARGDRDAIGPMRRTLEEICRREIAFVADDAVVEELTGRIVAKFMARPMTNLRGAGPAGPDGLREALRHLFEDPTAVEPAEAVPAGG